MALAAAAAAAATAAAIQVVEQLARGSVGAMETLPNTRSVKNAGEVCDLRGRRKYFGPGPSAEQKQPLMETAPE
eukprot:307712-Chlamydomonas_euryale.AAC.4